MQIRKRLIAANAPPKGNSIYRQIQWSRSSIQAILRSAREDAYGFKTYSRAGQTFHIPIVPFIYEKAARVERRETAIEDELNNTYANLDFNARVSAYVQDLQADLEDVINANPQSDEERHALFLRKRQYIDDLLEEVVIDGDRQIHVKFRADILRLVQGNKVA